MRTSTIAWAAVALVVPGLALGTAAIAQQQPERQQPPPQQQQPEQHAEARVGSPRDPVQPRPRAQPSPQQRAALMTGTFTLGMPEQEAVARVNHAIDQVVAQMSFFRRSFAMRRLRDRNPVRDQVQTEVTPGFVAVTYGDERHRTSVGQWQEVVALGEPVQLRQEITGANRFTQTFRSEDGEKETVFVFSENGRYLRLDVTVESSQLPTPLRYSLPYRRTTPYQAPA